MQRADTIDATRAAVRAARAQGKSIGLVPTMGALHAGHLALIEACRRRYDYVVVSIFVNPLQFGANEDLDRYPRTLDRDLAACEQAGVDLVFVPSVAEMYPQPMKTTIEVRDITAGLCGRSRPGHFAGVTTVVGKLFNIVQPDGAVFGQKDAQQAAAIKRMVYDLNFPITIDVVPTVREPDGLALSSRNQYLSAGERQAATVLFRALTAARDAYRQGEREAGALRRRMTDLIAAEPLAEIDYVELVDPETMAPLEGTLTGPALAAIAVWIGRTRLIDNMRLDR